MASRYKKIKLKTGETIDEHRLVFSRHIGRDLKHTEFVHHKNEDPRDNRIDNLEIKTPGDHARHHLLRHGAKRYKKGCRCNICLQARAAYKRRYRLNKLIRFG